MGISLRGKKPTVGVGISPRGRSTSGCGVFTTGRFPAAGWHGKKLGTEKKLARIVSGMKKNLARFVSGTENKLALILIASVPATSASAAGSDEHRDDERTATSTATSTATTSTSSERERPISDDERDDEHRTSTARARAHRDEHDEQRERLMQAPCQYRHNSRLARDLNDNYRAKRYFHPPYTHLRKAKAV